jgi:uncharacterized protein with FMN-binding domain
VAQSRFGAVIARTEAAPAPAGSQAPAGSMADGTRSATFTEGDVSATVQVTVKARAIESLALTGGKNVDQELAAKIFQKVKSAGSLAVDAVSGATASSNVLLKAIGEALSPR